jgi:hypothetical protein
VEHSVTGTGTCTGSYLCKNALLKAFLVAKKAFNPELVSYIQKKVHNYEDRSDLKKRIAKFSRSHELFLVNRLEKRTSSSNALGHSLKSISFTSTFLSNFSRCCLLIDCNSSNKSGTWSRRA